MRGAPSPSPDVQAKRKRSKKPLVIGGVVVLVLAGAGVGGYLWTQGKYYVGAANDGKVVVYKGISQSFLGLGLSSPTSASIPAVYVQELPTADQVTVKSNSAMSLGDAEVKVKYYKTEADTCFAYRHAPKNAVLPTGKVDSSIAPGTGPAKPGTAPTASTGPNNVVSSGPPSSAPPSTTASTGSVVPPTGASGPNQDMKALCAGSQDGPGQ
jgi:protein phosphatase